MSKINQCQTLSVVLLTVAAYSAAAGEPYRFTNVIDSSWSLPQGSIDDIFGDTLSNGTAAFRVSFDNRTHYGLFTGDGKSLQNLVNTGDPAPTGTFERIDPPSISDGEVVFTGHYLNGSGIFLSKDDSLIPVAAIGDPGPSGELALIGSPRINHGTVTFFAMYGEAPFLYEGIFKSDNGITSPVVLQGDPAPKGTIVGGFSLSPSVSGNNIAFGGSVTETTGVFRSDGQSLVEIVRGGELAPVGTFDASVAVGPPAISGDRVAFFAEFGEINSLGNMGVFVGSGGPLEVIAMNGSPAPDGVFGNGFSFPGIAGEHVAFGGSYQNSDGFQTGVFVSKAGTLSSVIATGESLFGSTVTFAGFGGLDDSGNGALTFAYRLADGRRGLAIATPVPESETLAPCVTLFAFVSLALRRRERLRPPC